MAAKPTPMQSFHSAGRSRSWPRTRRGGRATRRWSSRAERGMRSLHLNHSLASRRSGPCSSATGSSASVKPEALSRGRAWWRCRPRFRLRQPASTTMERTRRAPCGRRRRARPRCEPPPARTAPIWRRGSRRRRPRAVYSSARTRTPAPDRADPRGPRRDCRGEAHTRARRARAASPRGERSRPG